MSVNNDSSKHIKVMTFNIRVDVPQDGQNAWPYRKQKVPKMIQEHDPLVFGIQEGLARMLTDMDSELEQFKRIGEGRRGGMDDEFCAIYYQHDQLDVVEWGQFWLSETPHVANSVSWKSDLPRICTWAHFRLKHSDVTDFLFFNTHLDHMSQLARENGISLIWETMNDYVQNKHIPAILTGDLNSTPENDVIQFLRSNKALNGVVADVQDAFSVCAGNVGTTFHHFTGGQSGEPIDYIFTTPEVEVVNTEVDRRMIDGAYPSDHYPVISVLRLRE